MDDALKARLVELGLNEEQVGKMAEAGAQSAPDMALTSAEDIVAITGIGIIAARRIAHAFAPTIEPTPAPPAAVAATPLPAVNVTVTNNDPGTMRVSELLTAVAQGERDRDFVQALTKKVGARRRVYVRDENGRLDVDATMDLINEDIHIGEEPAFWGNQPTETLTEVLDVQRFNDPLTGEPITRGNPWLKLPIDDMAAVAYAKMKNFLRGTEDPYTIVNEAQSGNSERWTRVQNLWKRGLRSTDPMTLQARAAIYRRSGEGITTPREEVSATAGPRFRYDKE